jgi:hypothetical protein
MNDSSLREDELANASREEIMAALFANMVIQQTNMALMFLGKVPHPETGELINDIESAKMFIDQLEMLEFKTKGNLDNREEGLLKQSLTMLRMSFVEAIEGNPGASLSSEAETAQPPSRDTRTTQEELPQSSPPSGPAAEDEPRKKFSKKY